MREILNSHSQQSTYKQPRCYLNDLIQYAQQSKPWSNQHQQKVQWRSKEHPSVTSPLQGIVLHQDSAPNYSFVYDRIWVHPIIIPLPLPAMFQYKQDSFPPTIFFNFKFLFLFYLILFLSFQNFSLFWVGGGRSVNSFTYNYHGKVIIIMGQTIKEKGISAVTCKEVATSSFHQLKTSLPNLLKLLWKIKTMGNFEGAVG